MITLRPIDRDNTPFDTAVEILMAAMLVFLPLAFGTSQPWSQEIWFGLVAIMGLAVLIKPLVYRRTAAVWSWAYVPIVLFVALVVLQRTPLPRGLLQILSPHTLSMKDDLLDDLGPPASTATVSFYVLNTTRQLRLVLAVAAVFVIVLQTYRRSARRRRLLLTMAIAGAIVGLLAAYQDFSHATMIYGSVPIGHKNAGPFQNYSHFSQYMNLSVGAALGWLLMTLADWTAGWRRPDDALDQLKRSENGFFWAAVALCVGGPLLVFASMSRMGMISMLVAGGITAALLGWRGRPLSRDGHRKSGGTVFFILVFGLAVVAVLSAVGFDIVYDRLGTLKSQQSVAVGVRQNVLRDLIPLWKQFPLLGTGLGTHEFVFPMFSRQDISNIFTHAENEYAQLMEETGAVGMAMAAAFVAIIAAAFVRAIRSPKRPEQFAAFGLGFGLIAILIHSFSDFGQHMPAVATLTAICCALLIQIANAADRDAHNSSAKEPVSLGVGPWVGRIAAVISFTAGAAWVITAGDAERRASAAWAEAQDAGEAIAAGSASDEDYIRLLNSAASAANTLPVDVVYRHWLAAARWQLIARDAAEPATGKLLLTPEGVEFTKQVIADLDAVRPLCPTFGPPLGLAGQLRSQVLGQARGDRDIVRAYRLTPHDRELCRMAGCLAIKEKRFEEAGDILGRYVRLGGQLWRVVDAFLLANRPDLAQAAAARDRSNLLRLADGLTAGWPKEAARAAECRAEAERLLIEASNDPDAPPRLYVERGQLEEQNHHVAEAITWYQRAVNADYGQVDWRFQLARALGEVGQRDEAVAELRICLRFRPNWTDAENLLVRYSVGRSNPPASQP